jgi:hypothetical protein
MGSDENNVLNEYNANKTMYINQTKNLVSETEKVTQLNEETNKEYMLLIVWFMITLFVCVITLITVISESGMNPIGLIIVILFLLYILYYFMTNIYNMFK